MRHARAAGDKRAHRDALGVERHGKHRVPQGLVALREAGVARVLQGDGSTLAHQQRRQAAQHLRAGAHHDVGRAHLHAARLLEIGGDGVSQAQRALRRVRPEELALLLLREGPLEGALPQVGSRCPGSQRGASEVRDELLRARGFLDCLLSGPKLAGRGLFRGCKGARKLCGVVAALGARVDVALCHELGVGALDRDDAHPQLSCKAALGGELLPRSYAPGEDVLPDAPVEVLVEAELPPGAHVVAEHGYPSLTLSIARIRA